MAQSGSPTASTIDRKALKRPDQFTLKVREFFGKIAQNTRVVITGAVILLLAAVAGALYFNARAANEQEAANAYFVAAKSLDPAPPATASPSKEKKKQKKPELSFDSKYGAGIQKMSTVAKTYAGTPAAFQAQTRLGVLFFENQKFNDAVQWFGQAAADAPGRFEAAASYYSQGLAYENAGKPTEAVKSFEKALNLGEAAWKGQALLAMARGYEANKKNDEAKKAYNRIITEMSDTPYAATAKAYISAL